MFQVRFILFTLLGVPLLMRMAKRLTYGNPIQRIKHADIYPGMNCVANERIKAAEQLIKESQNPL